MEYISDLNCPTFQAQIARLSFITKNWGGGRPPAPPPRLVRLCLFSDITSFFLGTKKTVGEFFNPGLNCSDIMDKLDDAKDGFYWITLKRSNPVKVSVFVVFNIHHFRLFPSCFEIL